MPLGILVERVMIEESVVGARQGMIFVETETCVGLFSSQFMSANFVFILHVSAHFLRMSISKKHFLRSIFF
jgi:hypothetical protein